MFFWLLLGDASSLPGGAARHHVDDDGGGELKVGGWGPSNWISSRKLGNFQSKRLVARRQRASKPRKERDVGVLGFWGCEHFG